MSATTTPGRSRWLLLGSVGACLVAYLLGGERTLPDPDPASLAAAETGTAADRTTRKSTAETASRPLVEDRTTIDDVPPPTFAELLEQLVELGVAKLATGDPDQAAKLDRRGRTVLDHILTRIADPDNEALHTLTGMLSEDTSDHGQLRRSLCVGIVGRCLQRKYAAVAHGAQRTQLDQLVHSMLACIPMDEVLAGDLVRLLAGQPHLGVAHEAAVLDLATMATEDRYLIPLVTELLETLWKNLEDQGVRSARELAQLALLFHKDANPVKRLAALRLLLVAADGRYRELVLQEAVRGRDAELAEALTMVAANELPPAAAIRTLERLSVVTTRPLTVAFMTLGERHPQVLVEAYETRLADDTASGYRAELITGAGFRGGALGLELARTAFAHDPDPGVRSRALLVLTGQADSQEGERALHAALTDPATRGSPLRLGEVVLALENLAQTADGNAVERVARRLRDEPALHRRDLERLLRIVARSVPGHGGK